MLLLLSIFIILVHNAMPQYTAQPNVFIRQISENVDKRNYKDPVYISTQNIDISPLKERRFPNPTTIITDCTPSVCNDLGNLVQLMIVSNLMQGSSVGSEAALQLAMPILKKVLSSPAFTGVKSNPFKNNFMSPKLVFPNTPPVAPNIILQKLPLAANIASPNIYTLPPNIIYQNIPAAPKAVTPNIILENLPLAPNIASPNINSIPPYFIFEDLPLATNIASPNIHSLPPNVIYQNLPVPSNVVPPLAENIAFSNTNSLPPNIVFQNLPLASNIASPIENSVSPHFVIKNLPFGAPSRFSKTDFPNSKPLISFFI